MRPAGNAVTRSVGSRIRMKRLAQGLSQERLGAAAGLTLQQVRRYGQGIDKIGASRLHRIGQALGVPPSFFFEETHLGGRLVEAVEASPNVLAAAMADPLTMRFLQAYTAIDDWHRSLRLVEPVAAIASQPDGSVPMGHGRQPAKA
ncbi:helix-turn-helix domain-containing protein [Salinarimonas soli]|nr:helix-turn-helix transcriptional regulator [Salinarimonas soli]